MGQNYPERREFCFRLQKHEHKVLFLGRWEWFKVSNVLCLENMQIQVHVSFSGETRTLH